MAWPTFLAGKPCTVTLSCRTAAAIGLRSRRLALRPNAQPGSNATDGATSATRRGTGVTGLACGAGALPLRRAHRPGGFVAILIDAGGSSPLPSCADPTEGRKVVPCRPRDPTTLSTLRSGEGPPGAREGQWRHRAKNMTAPSCGWGQRSPSSGRSSDRLDAAGPADMPACKRSHWPSMPADQEVAARDAWLRWVNDDGYRGLNAGPFELRAGEAGA